MSTRARGAGEAVQTIVYLPASPGCGKAPEGYNLSRSAGERGVARCGEDKRFSDDCVQAERRQ